MPFLGPTCVNCIVDNGTIVGFWLYSFCCGLIMNISDFKGFNEVFLVALCTLLTCASNKSYPH